MHIKGFSVKIRRYWFLCGDVDSSQFDLSWQEREISNLNDGSVAFKCPSKPRQCDREPAWTTPGRWRQLNRIQTSLILPFTPVLFLLWQVFSEQVLLGAYYYTYAASQCLFSPTTWQILSNMHKMNIYFIFYADLPLHFALFRKRCSGISILPMLLNAGRWVVCIFPVNSCW